MEETKAPLLAAIVRPLSSMRRRGIDASLVHAVAVGLAASATAWNSRENGFVWDDRAAVVGNNDVDASQSQWWEMFYHDFWGNAINTKTSHKSYRPLTVLSFRWDHSWHGLDPHGFHATNVMVHAICSVLVWCTARVVLREKGKHPDWGSLLAGLLFAVHPIHCDSVASIVGRADLLCVMFSLGGFLAYDVAESHQSWSFVLLAGVSGVCACLCKELGITVFGIYAAHSITRALASCPRGSFFIPRASVYRLSCVLVSSLGLLLARLWVNGEQTKATFNILANSINIEEKRLIRWMSYAHVHAWYLWKLVWPSWFSYDYGFNTIPVITDVTDPRNLLSALAYATVMLGLTKGFRDIQHSPLVMCIAFGVIPFVPASNIFFPVGTVVAERLLYFPSVGFCLIVGYTANQFVSSLDRMDDRMMTQAQDHTSFRWRSFSGPCVRRLSATLVAFLLSTSMYKSIVRNAEWQSEETLFTAAVGVVPENVKVLNNAAKVLLNKDSKRALQLARASVAMMPDHIEGQSNLGLAFTFGEPKKVLAIRHMVKSFAYTSTEAAGAGYAGSHLYDYWIGEHNGSASVERMMQSPTVKFALNFLDKAIQRRSCTPMHFYQRAVISEHLHDFSASLRYMDAARRMNDRIVTLGLDAEMVLERGPLHNRVAVIKRQLGNDDEAITELLVGMELYPAEPSFYFNMASIHLARGQLAVAAEFLERCLHVCEGADVILNGARLLERLDQKDAARLFVERATSVGATLS